MLFSHPQSSLNQFQSFNKSSSLHQVTSVRGSTLDGDIKATKLWHWRLETREEMEVEQEKRETESE
jgi:hypothetical protein